jgi:hypothetical protein
VAGTACALVVDPRFSEKDRLRFQIHAALPLVGVVAGYRGHLVIPREEPT